MMISDRANRSLRLSRRTLLSLLGAGAGWELASVWRGDTEGAAALQAAAQSAGKQVFPKGAIIRTVLKDIPPGELTPGATLFHEHILADTVSDEVIAELKSAKDAGISCFVNAKSERALNVANLKTISTRSGMHIVACTGFYMEYTYPPELATKSEDQIADDFVQEAKREGFGAYGEMGQSPNTRELSPAERKVFRAAGKAHLRTNLPIFTHNPYGTGPNVPARRACSSSTPLNPSASSRSASRLAIPAAWTTPRRTSSNSSPSAGRMSASIAWKVSTLPVLPVLTETLSTLQTSSG